MALWSIMFLCLDPHPTVGLCGSEKCWCLICSLMLWNLTGLLVFLGLDELQMSNWHRVHETDLDARVYSHSIHINVTIVTNHNLEAWHAERFKCCQYNLHKGSQWEKFTKSLVQPKLTRDKSSRNLHEINTCFGSPYSQGLLPQVCVIMFPDPAPGNYECITNALTSCCWPLHYITSPWHLCHVCGQL